MMNVVNQLIKETKEYLGVKWKHQGRSKNGIDCVGLLIEPCKKLGIDVYEIKGYPRKPDGVQLKSIMDNQPAFEPVREPYLPGDIILFKIRKEPQHVALLSGEPGLLSMVHAFNGGNKKVVEHRFAGYWRDRVISGYRLIE